MNGDDKQNPAITTGVPSPREMPNVEVDMGSPVNIPGTNVAVSAADFEVEPAPGFGIPLLSLFKDLPPLPPPEEDEREDAPKTRLTQDSPSRKGGISLLFFAALLTLFAC